MRTGHSQSDKERLERLLKMQELLGEVSRKLGPALELSPVLSTVLSAMRSTVVFRGGTIQLVDDGGVFIAAADPPVSSDLAATRVPIGKGLSGRAIGKASTIYSPDLDTDPRVDPVQRRTGNNASTRSYLVVPLVVLGECIGALQIDSEVFDAFDADDVTVLEGLATLAAGAIESARRYEEVLELKRMKQTFVALVSHELRTPLTIVRGFIDLLVEGAPGLDEEKRHHALTRIQSSVDRLQSMIEDVLYVSNLDAGFTQALIGEVLLADVCDEARSLSIDPGRVEVSVAVGMRTVADPILLRHVLSKLVDNALKYGGDAVISATVDSASGDAILSVRDHGPGIPAEQRALIFEPFWRGEAFGGGLGLGLATVRQLAGSFGAEIFLSDPEGGGTQINVRLKQR